MDAYGVSRRIRPSTEYAPSVAVASVLRLQLQIRSRSRLPVPLTAAEWVNESATAVPQIEDHIFTHTTSLFVRWRTHLRPTTHSSRKNARGWFWPQMGRVRGG